MTPSLRVGFTCGAFDLLHPGHLDLLEWSRHQCDYLVVGLHTNPTLDRPTEKESPVQTVFERWFQLKSVENVDEIIPYDTEHDLCNLLAMLNLNVRILGSDYINRPVTGDDICRVRGIEIVYAPRLHTFSSTELRNRLRAPSHDTRTIL